MEETTLDIGNINFLCVLLSDSNFLTKKPNKTLKNLSKNSEPATFKTSFISLSHVLSLNLFFPFLPY